MRPIVRVHGPEGEARVEAVADITSRIADIQSRIAHLDQLTGARRTAGGVLGGAAVGLTTTQATSQATGTTSSFAAEFGAVLDDVVRQTGATAPGYGKHLVDAKDNPIEFQRYGNGKIPASALAPISGAEGHRLWAPAASSFEALRDAARADGVTIGITDSYRPYDVQVDLARRKGLYSQGGLAATPGTSDHGWGTALDLRLDAKALAWMRQNAGRFGFVEDVPRESWHWHYVPTH